MARDLLIVGGLVALGIYFIERKVPALPSLKDFTELTPEQQKVKEIGIAASVGEEKKTVQVETIAEDGTPTTKEVDVSVKKFGECVTDANCQGDALFGARYRCIGGRCRALAKSESSILFNPVEINARDVCKRDWLAGLNQPCDRDSQCSSNGNTCATDEEDCVFAGPTSAKIYCNDGRCKSKTKPDWIGITWKQEGNQPIVDKLGLAVVKNETWNRKKQECPELESVFGNS